MGKELMEYKIVSGRTVEIRRAYLTAGKNRAARRGLRCRASSLKKISANERDAVLRLARTINCNFDRGDLWITLTHTDATLPESVEAGKEMLAKLMRKLRESFRKTTGKKIMPFVTATADRSSETGELVRLHHHLVLPAECEEIIKAMWPEDDITIRHLDGRGDHTALARYIIGNTSTGENGGKQRYQTAKGMRKPVVTEPVPVRMSDRVRVPSDAKMAEQQVNIDSDAPYNASMYVRFIRARNPNGRYRDLKIGGM